MRNAATLDDDFGYDAPAARKATRKPRAGASAKRKKKATRFSWDRVARFGAIGISATVGVGIMVNALMMQKGHHPAPLFGRSLPPHIEPASTAASQPSAQSDHAANSLPSTTPDDSASGKTHRAPSTASAAAMTDTAASGEDPIAQLLNGSRPATVDKADSKTVMGVQKALAKLGFSLKANGAMGVTTRKAIETFEKDHHLPVNGEISKRLVKALASQSGVHIE